MNRSFNLLVSLIIGPLAPFLVAAHAAPSLHTGISADMEFQVEEVLSGLDTPWGLAFIASNQLICTERNGTISIIDVDSGKQTLLQGGPKVFAKGQGGMLDVAVPQGYKSGDWIYFTYSKKKGFWNAATALGRAKLDGHQLVEWQDLLVTKSATDEKYHFGSRITFDGQGHLFFGIGDRGKRPNGQKLSTHAGSILRLNLDGTVPKDNPFVQGGGLPEIWSYGHRNPQGIFYDLENKRLWSNEHGPKGGDEINLILPGKNYGWPVVSHGEEYWGPVAVGEAKSKKGMEDPVKVYIPSIAPGSLLLYSGEAFPNWQGNLFSGALALQHLNRVVLSDNGKAMGEERLLEGLDERMRAIVESPEGWLYISTDSGKILRVRPRTES